MNAVRKQQSYNLPGFGLMRVRLYPHAKMVFDFLQQYEHVEQLKRIDQLGPIRDVFPGAHHTRYEYLMAQLALLTELCHLKGPLPAGLALSRRRDTFGKLPGLEESPSNGEILMVLSLLGNIGHLPTTFSGERAFLEYLRHETEVRRAFRDGLPSEDRARFDELLQNDNIYQFHYYITLFLLNRYRRRTNGPEIVRFCQKILRSYLTVKVPEADQALHALWRLYKSIRRLTFLALDSHYAPVPFSLDLSSIFINLEHYLEDVFLEGSAFQDALERLEGVMRDTVYLAPPTLLNHGRVAEEILAKIQEDEDEPRTGISALWDLLMPGNVEAVFGHPGPPAEPPPRRELLTLSYRLDAAMARAVLAKPMAWETGARKRVGLRSCRFAADFDPRKEHLRVAASIKPDLDLDQRWKIALRVVKQAVDLDIRIQKHVQLTPMDVHQSGLALLRFLLGAALEGELRYRLRSPPVVNQPPIRWAYGSTRTSKLIQEYRDWAEESHLLDADALNEVWVLKEALQETNYQGAVLAFAGGTEILSEQQPVAEFDGVAFLLSRSASRVTILIVEAKNMASGHKRAEEQLRERIPEVGIPEEQFTIKYIANKGAVAEIRLASD